MAGFPGQGKESRGPLDERVICLHKLDKAPSEMCGECDGHRTDCPLGYEPITLKEKDHSPEIPYQC